MRNIDPYEAVSEDAFYRSLNERLVRMALELDGKAVGDIGCGTGSVAEIVLEIARPSAMWCVDPDEGMVAAASRRLDGRATVLRGRAENIEGLVPHDTLDVAFLANCIHLVEDVDGMLGGLRKVMRSDGLVLVSTAFYDRAALPQDGPLYRRLVMEAAKVARRMTGERRTSHPRERPLAKRQLTEQYYREVLHEADFRVDEAVEISVELTSDLLLRIASSPMFASGALPGVDPEVAVHAVTTALREFPGFQDIKVGRRWLYLSAACR